MQQAQKHQCGNQSQSEMTDIIDERQLLQRFVEKQDQSAFETLMKLHGRLVYGVCRRLLGHAQDAEDAFQATFLILARKAGSIRRSEHLSHWLYQVARRTSLKARFASAKRRETQMPSNTPETTIESKDLWPEVEPWLDQELSRLPEAYRLPIIVCDLEGRTHKEAARELDVPEGTFSTRLVKAREMLAQRLVRRGLVLPAGILALMISENAASAAVPPSLFASTATAVGSFATTGTAPAGTVSAGALLLAKESLTAVLTTKMVMAAMLAVSVIVGGAGFMMIPDPKPMNSVSAIDAERQIEALGGKLSRANNDPRQPVTAISFYPTNQFADEHAHLLKSFNKLTSLSLKGTRVTDESFEEIGTLSKLTFLDFSNTEITGANLDKLNGIKFLVALVLDSTKISDSSLKNLSGLPHLGGLFLRSCEVSDEGLKILRELPIRNEIRSLGLESTNVTDIGLEYLADFKQLNRLVLGGSQITDASTKPLEKLRQLKQLELKDTAISDNNVKEIFAALPNLKTPVAGDHPVINKGESTVARRTPNRSMAITLIIGNLIALCGISYYLVRKRQQSH